MTSLQQPFVLNVGFIVAQTVGYSREFPCEFEQVRLEEDIFREVQGTITVTRTGQGLLFQTQMGATTEVACTRCLENFSLRLESRFDELFAFSANAVAETDLIVPESGRIDFAPLLREYLLLEVPIQPVCRPTCKGLCPVCGGNLNQTVCQHEEDFTDPRFAILKQLLNSSPTSDESGSDAL
ncbi:MAG: hypothetical protein OHK0052_02360 [Anaerolineales bacterium]